MSKPPPSVRRSAPARLRSLDGLRGIAALGVLLFHYTTAYDLYVGHEANIPHFDIGQRGVQIFFMVSGFVIFMSLERISSGTDFAVGRFARLYPTYWVGVVITSLVLITVGLEDHGVGFGQFLAHLTMVHRWFDIADIDGAYWTLSVEMGFYALMLLAYRLRCLHRIEVIGASVVAVVFGLQVVDALAGYPLAGYDTPRIFASSLHLFFVGILLYRLPEHHAPRTVGLLAACLAIEGVVHPEHLIPVLAGALVIGLVRFGRLSLLGARPLVWLGSISYPLYVVHQKVGDTVISELYAAGVSNPVVILGLPIAVAFALAIAMHHAIELPSQRWLARWREQRRAARDDRGVGRPPLAA